MTIPGIVYLDGVTLGSHKAWIFQHKNPDEQRQKTTDVFFFLDNFEFIKQHLSKFKNKIIISDGDNKFSIDYSSNKIAKKKSYCIDKSNTLVRCSYHVKHNI